MGGGLLWRECFLLDLPAAVTRSLAPYETDSGLDGWIILERVLCHRLESLVWYSPGSLTRRKIRDTAGYKRVSHAFEGAAPQSYYITTTLSRASCVYTFSNQSIGYYDTSLWAKSF